MSVDEWNTQVLRDLVTINYGKSPAEILSSEGSYPVVGTGGIDRIGTDFLYDGDSIILGRKGTIDRVYFTTGKFWVIDTAYYLSEFIEAYPRWLFYFLQAIDLRQMNEATGVPSLSRDALYKIKVQTPSLKEQEQIAAVLSTIDLAIAQTEAIITKQQRIKTGLMQDLLTKGIDENGNIRSEETHEFKDSPLGRIPVEWEVSSLGEVVSKYGGKLQTGPFGSQLHSHEYVNEGVPVVMPQDITNSGISTSKIVQITDSKANSLGRHRMLTNDLVFARRGDLSRCAVIQSYQEGWICGTGCLLLRPPQKVLLSNYICNIYRYHTTQVQVAIQAVGSTMANLNTKILCNLLIPLPKHREQTQIENRLDALGQDYMKLIERKEKLNAIKTGLMQDLLTGKVRVTELLKDIDR